MRDGGFVRAPLFALALSLACGGCADAALLPSIVYREPTPTTASELEQAGTLAASMGEYGFAIQAFEQAYRDSRLPALLFATAEAYRERYALESRPEDLERSIGFYRSYQRADPTGERALDAERTLAKLTAELGTKAIDPDAGEKAHRAETRTRVAALSPLASAVVRIDRHAPQPVPVFVELAPGKHVLEVSAPGYSSASVKIDLAPGAVDVETVSLDPAPARLDVASPTGADVYVDRVAVGIVPLPSPIDVDPGKHVVTISMNGHLSHTERVTLVRGKTQKLSVDLDTTRQRTAAWALVGTGGAGMAAGIALGVLAVVRDRAASSVVGRRNETLSASAQKKYDDDIAARDRFRVGAGVAGGVGLGLAVVGGFLFAFDGPTSPAASGKPKTGEPRIWILPSVDPSFAGAATMVRF